MIRHFSKILQPKQRYYFGVNKFLIGDYDTANMIGLLLVQSQPLMMIDQKLHQFTVSSIYSTIDEFSRQLLFTFANDYGLGVGLSIILISTIIKSTFIYPSVMSQINALKMNELKPHFERVKQKMKIAQMTRNNALRKQATADINRVRRQKGINMSYNFYNLLQIPFLMTWFFSLRYLTSLPELYTQMQYEGLFWFVDLSTYDPYFLLPLIAASFSSYTIIISPNMSRRNITIPAMVPFIKYLKFLPFLSLPITAFFPAAINLYWCTVAINQLFITLLIRNKKVRQNLGYKHLSSSESSKIPKAVFVQQKQSKKKINQQQQQSSQKQISNNKNEELFLVGIKPKKNIKSSK